MFTRIRKGFPGDLMMIVLLLLSGCCVKSGIHPARYQTKYLMVQDDTFDNLPRRLNDALGSIDQKGGEVLSLCIVPVKSNDHYHPVTYRGVITYRLEKNAAPDPHAGND